jgi:hypothetical protein
MKIETLSLDPRITVRKPGAPNPEGECVIYWMQRAQRALDNPALNVAVELGNELAKPVIVFWLLSLLIRTLISVTTAFSLAELRTSKKGSANVMWALSCERTQIRAWRSFANITGIRELSGEKPSHGVANPPIA